jgi:hypothetical protein
MTSTTIKQDTPIPEHDGFFQFFLVAASVYYDERDGRNIFLIDIFLVITTTKGRHYEENHS